MRALTIAYITARKEPHLDWFMESLANELVRCGCSGREIQVLIVDHLCSEFGLRKRTSASYVIGRCRTKYTATKPSVWQGKHRLTEVDFFSASNARNTAICLCETKWIAMVDDLSVLMPGWLKQAFKAMAYDGCVTCGSFSKKKGMIISDGFVKKFTDYPEGHDWRMKQSFKDKQPLINYRCPPEWFFGCSFVAPLDALLSVNGYPEYLCDGLGYEDSIMGKMLYRAGIAFRFDPLMMTWESEDDHHNQPAMLRIDPGLSPDDKSHAVQAQVAKASRAWFEQDFGGIEHIEDLRAKVQAGGPWPVPTGPKTEWFTGMPLSEFHNYKP